MIGTHTSNALNQYTEYACAQAHWRRRGRDLSFSGGADIGQRGAILYTVIEAYRRHLRAVYVSLAHFSNSSRSAYGTKATNIRSAEEKE